MRRRPLSGWALSVVVWSITDVSCRYAGFDFELRRLRAAGISVPVKDIAYRACSKCGDEGRRYVSSESMICRGDAANTSGPIESRHERGGHWGRQGIQSLSCHAQKDSMFYQHCDVLRMVRPCSTNTVKHRVIEHCALMALHTRARWSDGVVPFCTGGAASSRTGPRPASMPRSTFSAAPRGPNTMILHYDSVISD
jgi:hypothetical protein